MAVRQEWPALVAKVVLQVRAEWVVLRAREALQVLAEWVVLRALGAEEWAAQEAAECRAQRPRIVLSLQRAWMQRVLATCVVPVPLRRGRKLVIQRSAIVITMHAMVRATSRRSSTIRTCPMT